MTIFAAESNTLAEIEVPRQFSALENLADEAGDNMSQAASLYREVGGGEEYNEMQKLLPLNIINRGNKADQLYLRNSAGRDAYG